MPITKAIGYKDGNGAVHSSLKEAQLSELAALMEQAMPPSEAAGTRNMNYHQLADAILANADDILQVLTTGPKSRPGARKRAGTTSPRRAAAIAKTPRVAASNGATSITPPPPSAHVEQIAGT